MQVKTNKITHVFNPKSPQKFVAIQDVTSVINQGESISIIGHTGSGKTTYIEHLNALIKPTSGTINLKYKVGSNDKELLKLNKKIDKSKTEEKQKQVREEIKAEEKNTAIIEIERNLQASKRKIKNIKQIRKRIGVVFQFAEYQLFEESIEKDIMFGPITMGMSKEKSKEQAAKYLKLVGMPSSFLSKSPFELSGGQKRM